MLANNTNSNNQAPRGYGGYYKGRGGFSGHRQGRRGYKGYNSKGGYIGATAITSDYSNPNNQQNVAKVNTIF